MQSTPDRIAVRKGGFTQKLGESKKDNTQFDWAVLEIFAKTVYW